MPKLDTKHKKKSFIITTIIHVVIILLLFFLGLDYLDPPPENGIAINFGTTETGSGEIQPTEEIKSSPKQTTPETASEISDPEPETAEITEEVLTQEIEDAPVIEEKPKKEPIKKVKEPKKKPKDKPKSEKPVEKKIEKKPDPKPDKSTLDILDSFSNGPKNDGKTNGGEGDETTTEGDKGDPNGDINAKSYYGKGQGLDGDGNYRLGGRKALNKEKIVQKCNESGIVVVKIEVNQAGKVIKAIAGVKGTTNSASCLLEPAKQAALATRFNNDNKAPSKQIGTIVYQFKLSE